MVTYWVPCPGKQNASPGGAWPSTGTGPDQDVCTPRPSSGPGSTPSASTLSRASSFFPRSSAEAYVMATRRPASKPSERWESLPDEACESRRRTPSISGASTVRSEGNATPAGAAGAVATGGGAVAGTGGLSRCGLPVAPGGRVVRTVPGSMIMTKLAPPRPSDCTAPSCVPAGSGRVESIGRARSCTSTASGMRFARLRMPGAWPRLIDPRTLMAEDTPLPP